MPCTVFNYLGVSNQLLDLAVLVSCSTDTMFESRQISPLILYNTVYNVYSLNNNQISQIVIKMPQQ